MRYARRSLPVLLALVAGAALALPAFAEPRDADEVLPIRTITLHRSGVGSFVRSATLDGPADLEFTFDNTQINDILKSLVVVNKSGLGIQGVSYASNVPLQRRLSAFAIDVSQGPSVESLLRQLAGEKVTLTTGKGKVTGSVLSVENRRVPVVSERGEQMQMADHPHVTLLTSSGITSIDVYDVTAMDIENPQISDELERALMVLAEHRAERSTTFTLSLNQKQDAKEEHPLLVGYTHEMPVWKTSYRLVLAENEASNESATLQAWAIVENTTDADWENVRLSLASGRPVSFTMDLYQSIFLARPALPVPVGGSLLPTLYEAGQELLRDAAPMDAAKRMRESVVAERAVSGRAGKPSPPGSASTFADSAGLDIDEVLEQSMAGGGLGEGQASGEQTGGQFLYTIDAPVSIARQQSAMLPLVVTDIPCRRVSVFNPNEMPKHPMRGCELTNKTGLHLMPGPIAVYDAGVYAGDSQVPHMSRNNNQLMTYALDLDVFVQSTPRMDSNLSKLRIAGGLLERTDAQKLTRTYEFTNKDDSDGRTIIVEHPRTDASWELQTQQGLKEKTDGVYRYEVSVQPSGKTELVVEERRTIRQTMSLNAFDMETLLAFARDGKLSDAALKAIQAAANFQHQINVRNQEVAALNTEVNEIANDQNRIRNNMGTISPASDLYKRYEVKLGEQETRLEKILERRDTLHEEVRQIQNELDAYVADLTVE